MRIRKIIRNFRHNIRFLFLHDIVEEKQDRVIEYTDFLEQYYHYALKEMQEEPLRPIVLDAEATIRRLRERPRSFCRFGDGELEVLRGGGCSFQKADARLADYLKTILSAPSKDFYVGVPYRYFHSLERLGEQSRRFTLIYGPRYRRLILDYCNFDQEYLDAAFSSYYISSSASIDRHYFDAYFHEVKSLFRGKNVILFAGEGVFTKLTSDVFEEARSQKLVEAPSRDAFDDFDALLAKARMYPKDTLLCFILGPTAKPLCYELSKDGYLAWDIGHLAKDYDAYCKNIQRSPEALTTFMSPD